jgi:hypothetical protein
MRAMVVEVGPEIEQLVFEVCRRPEQHVIQVFPPQGAGQPFHEWVSMSVQLRRMAMLRFDVCE